MKKCILCGSMKDDDDVFGRHCGLCEKIASDVQADLAAELNVGT